MKRTKEIPCVAFFLLLFLAALFQISDKAVIIDIFFDAHNHKHVLVIFYLFSHLWRRFFFVEDVSVWPLLEVVEEADDGGDSVALSAQPDIISLSHSLFTMRSVSVNSRESGPLLEEGSTTMSESAFSDADDDDDSTAERSSSLYDVV